jgi:hypothetical protein
VLLAATFTPANAAAVFGPDPATTPLGSSVTALPVIVSDGQTSLHSVVEDTSLDDVLVYRRSQDGGRHWTPLARFRGEDGGVDEASVAASGAHVAVTYLGAWCPDPDSCATAPYLVESRDGGTSWGTPVRLGSSALSVSVAVDGSRTWVSWWRGGAVEIRSTSDAGHTFDATRTFGTGIGSSQVFVAAAGGVAVVAWMDWRAEMAGSAVVARGLSVGPVQPLPPLAIRSAGDRPVAVADGRAHVGINSGTETSPIVSVATADSRLGPGTFGAPVDIGAADGARGSGVANSLASLAARRGLLAVSFPSPSGEVLVATSADAGSSFSAPVAVASSGAGFTSVGLAVAAVPDDQPVARFDWSVPDRYVDSDSDGRPDPANDTGDPAIDGLTVDKIDVTVRLNGCQSLASSGAQPAITGWSWTVDGDPLPSTTCEASFEGRDDVPAVVRLEVTDSAGERASTVSEVTPRDLLVVSIGDSVASGEGSPHVAATGLTAETWQDNPCHRSAYAGPALAARDLELADEHSSVTFVQLACSGAAVMDVPALAGASPDPADPDDPSTGGLLDDYAGVEPNGAAARPSQLAQLADLKGTRPVDAMTVSIGANDVAFSQVVEECLLTSATDLGPCHSSGTRDRLDARLATLPARYDALAGALDDLGVAPSRVFLTEYFNLTSDDLDLADLRCILDAPTAAAVLALTSPAPAFTPYLTAALATGLVTDDEAEWARGYVGAQLNASVRAAVSAHGWRYVGGIEDRFARHGYCASDPWVVRLGQTVLDQHDPFGAFHPNRAGQRAYADALQRSLRSSTLLPTAEPTGSGALTAADAYLVTATDKRVVATALRDTGGAPTPTGARLMDVVSSGEGSLVSGSQAVAAHRGAAVGGWVQLDTGGPVTVAARVGQIAAGRNASVQRVRVVQAPETAESLVTDRDTVVLARVDATVPGPYYATVTTEVFASGGPGGDRDIVTTTEQVRLVPGRNDLLLPDGATFRPEEGESVGAVVTVTDPAGSDPANEADNQRSAVDDVFPPSTATSRPLAVTVLPVDVVGGPTVACEVLARLTRRTVDFLTAAVPVAREGVAENLSCASSGAAPTPRNEPGVLQALTDLDLAARLTASDVVVGVVPPGWLQQAVGGAIGVAAAGLRAVVVESSAPSEVLAHEYAHTLGVDHTAARTPGPGARVPTRAVVDGIDWMNPSVVERPWTGGATWDTMLTRIGGPDLAPTLPNPASPGIWVRGTVYRNPDGVWVVDPATWVPAGSSAPIGPDLSDELELERMTIQQRAEDGSVLHADPIGLGAMDGLWGAGAPTASVTGMLGYGQYLALDPAATSVRLLLDGAPVETRPVTAAPAVTVDAPVAGAVVGRSEQLTVSWTATDPEDDPLTADVLVSGDEGLTWAPFARAAPGASSVTAPVPADLGGDAVRVRVVVSDGVRSALDDSASFTVDGGVTHLPERVVLARANDADQIYTNSLWTMSPDGGEQVKLPLPTRNEVVDDPNCADPDRNYRCDPKYHPFYQDPVWSPDGERVAFASTVRTIEAGSTSQDAVSMHIWTSRLDGTELRRLTPERTEFNNAIPEINECPAWSPDGTRIAWFAYTQSVQDRPYPGVWVADADGSDLHQVLRAADLATAPRPADWPTPSGPVNSGLPPAETNISGTFGGYGACPQWSPDSSSLVLTAIQQYDYVDNATTKQYVDMSAVVVVGADGSSPRFVSPRKVDMRHEGCCIFSPDRFASVSWNGSDLVVARETRSTSLGASTTAAWRLKPTTSELVRLSPDYARQQGPRWLKTAPDGSLYGTVMGDETCSPAPPPQIGDICLPNYDLGVIDPDSGEVTVVSPRSPGADGGYDWIAPVTSGPAVEQVLVPPSPTPGAADAGGPYAAVVDGAVDLDAGASTLLAVPGGATADVEWDLDMDGSYDDADGVRPAVSFPSAGTRVVRVRVSPAAGPVAVSPPTDVVVANALVEAALVADGADAVADPSPLPADVTATVPAGETSAVQLHTVGDVPGTAFEVTSAPPSTQLEIESPPDVPGGTPTTLTDGLLHVTPAPAFRGTLTLQVRVAGTTGPTATVTLTVTGNSAPAPADDVLVLASGVGAEIPVGQLLGNDTDPDDDPLTVVGVSRLEGDLVVALDVDGRLHVRPGAVGAAAFSYRVADPDGAIATGRVAVTVEGPPGVPGGPVLVPGDRSLTAGWAAPATDGGRPVTGYLVQHRVQGSATWTEEAVSGASLLIAGLLNGTTYDVRVAAVNGRGTGPFTVPVAATPTTVPGLVGAVSVRPRTGGLDVGWAAPSDTGGSPVTDYVLEYSVAGSGHWTRWPTGGASTTAVIVGLAPSTAYDVRIAASNLLGTGPWTAPVRSTVLAATGKVVKPEVRGLPARVGTLTAARVLRTSGSPASALRSGTPSTCAVQAGRVLFLDGAGPCRLSVVQAGKVVRRLHADVRPDGPRRLGAVAPQRLVTSSFRGDSPRLSTASRRTLQAAVPTLRRAGAVAVYGYSSSSRPGVSTPFADRLSLARARAVAAFLRQRRVDVVVVVGYGARHPIAGGPSANRRAVTGWTP